MASTASVSEALSIDGGQTRLMNTGLWVWPSDAAAQRKVLLMIAASPQLVQAMTFLMKSKGGLSNSELDDLTSDSSNWVTLWTVRQLTALGFIDFTVDFFGGPARYNLTNLGRTAFAVVTHQPLPQKPADKPPAAQTSAAPTKPA